VPPPVFDYFSSRVREPSFLPRTGASHGFFCPLDAKPAADQGRGMLPRLMFLPGMPLAAHLWSQSPKGALALQGPCLVPAARRAGSGVLAGAHGWVDASQGFAQCLAHGAFPLLGAAVLCDSLLG